MSDIEFLEEFRKELTSHTLQISAQSSSINYIKDSVDEIKNTFKDNYKITNTRINTLEKDSITKISVFKTIILIIAALSAVGTIMALN